MKLDAIGIVASDLDRTIAFYRLLDLSFERQPGMDHCEARTASGLRVMLDSEALIKKIVPGWTRQQGNTVVLAFDCGKPTDVDTVYRSILDAGHRKKTEPWDAFWGQRYA